MQAIRQVIDVQKLKGLIDIPDDFSCEQVEIIIFPIVSETKTPFNPEQFFGSSQLEQVDLLLETMRNEWES